MESFTFVVARDEEDPDLYDRLVNVARKNHGKFVRPVVGYSGKVEILPSGGARVTIHIDPTGWTLGVAQYTAPDPYNPGMNPLHYLVLTREGVRYFF